MRSRKFTEFLKELQLIVLKTLLIFFRTFRSVEFYYLKQSEIEFVIFPADKPWGASNFNCDARIGKAFCLSLYLGRNVSESGA